MKRDWEISELQENWTLQPGELALLSNKNDENRLGFALLLKNGNDFHSHLLIPETLMECHFREDVKRKMGYCVSGCCLLHRHKSSFASLVERLAPAPDEPSTKSNGGPYQLD